MIRIPKYTIGTGDRFGRQGEAQLGALSAARSKGIEISPVWNKSYREHSIIGTQPEDVRGEADSAVSKLGWEAPYFVDADHINLKTVDAFLVSSDFFTLDVADAIGANAGDGAIETFIKRREALCGTFEVPGLDAPLRFSCDRLREIAGKYLFAVQEAGRIYRRIAEAKNSDTFVTEVSMDETNNPQTPEELFVILAMIADAEIPAQTIAPRFSGRFNKGVDYVGDVEYFAREFRADLAVIACAVREFGLPDCLKLSLHSGSDKFSIYPVIADALRAYDAGLHVKTAGTTWLEELIGLAESGGDGLAIAVDVYRGALQRYQELAGPYAEVIDIDRALLPGGDEVAAWDGGRFAAALRHDSACSDYNPNFRQLLHIAYKLAAEMGNRYTDAIDLNRDVIARNVGENLLLRHITPVFGKGEE